MVLMFKKGDYKGPNNYLGINLLNTLKLTTQIEQNIQLGENNSKGLELVNCVQKQYL